MTGTSAASSRGARIAAVDRLRGLVMIVMVLDHVRDFFHDEALLFGPTDLSHTYPALFATRWITHFCAPVFVLLAGMSAALQVEAGRSRGEIARRLATRGLWLVLMEVTVVGFALSFRPDFFFLQVIWVIGWSMVALAGLIWLPRAAIAAIGLAMIAGHNLLDGVQAQSLGPFALPFAFLHQQTPLIFGGHLWGVIAYPLVPWVGVMAMGYALGDVFRLEPPRRRSLMIKLGVGLIAVFVVLRAVGIYGEPRAWTAYPDIALTVMDFLNVTKYPPSLLYLCATLGPALVALGLLERKGGRVLDVLATYGAVPFFFYVAHLYLAHSLSVLLSLAQGYGVWGVRDVFTRMDALRGFGLPLWGVYLVWIGVVAALYPPCRWFATLKRRHPGGWLSYL